MGGDEGIPDVRIRKHKHTQTHSFRLEANIVVAGIGSVADLSLFKDQLVLAEGGIKVNAK